MTPDWADKPTGVPYAEFGDPQSLNLYSYVGNNPLSRTDADGHFASPWHFLMSFAAAIVTGHNPIYAVKLGIRNALWDRGTQGASSDQTHLHAMAAQDESPEQAYNGTAETVDANEKTGDDAAVQHTVQDSFAWGHRYSPWTSRKYRGLGFWGTVKHEVGDWLPTPWTLGRAFFASVKALHDPDADPGTLLPRPPGRAPQPNTGPSPGNLDPSHSPRLCIGCWDPNKLFYDEMQKHHSSDQ